MTTNYGAGIWVEPPISKLGGGVFLNRGALFGIILGAGLLLLFVAVTWYSTVGYQATGGNRWSWNGMMGGMWGNNYYNSGYSANPVLQYLWVSVLAAIVLCLLGAAGLIYHGMYPQIKLAPATAVPSSSSTAQSLTQSSRVATTPPQSGSPSSTFRPTGDGGRGEAVSLAAEKFQQLEEPDALKDSRLGEASKVIPEVEPALKMVSWPVLLRTSKLDERRVLEVLASHNGKYLQKYIAKEAGLSKLRTHRIVARFVERGIATTVRSGNTNEVYLADWLGKNPEPKQPNQHPPVAQ